MKPKNLRVLMTLLTIGLATNLYLINERAKAKRLTEYMPSYNWETIARQNPSEIEDLLAVHSQMFNLYDKSSLYLTR